MSYSKECSMTCKDKIHHECFPTGSHISYMKNEGQDSSFCAVPQKVDLTGQNNPKFFVFFEISVTQFYNSAQLKFESICALGWKTLQDRFLCVSDTPILKELYKEHHRFVFFCENSSCTQDMLSASLFFFPAIQSISPLTRMGKIVCKQT